MVSEYSPICLINILIICLFAIGNKKKWQQKLPLNCLLAAVKQNVIPTRKKSFNCFSL